MKKRIYKHVSKPYEAIKLIEGDGRTHYEWRDVDGDERHQPYGQKPWGITCVSTPFFEANYR